MEQETLGRMVSGSLASRIALLEVGESESKVKRMDGDHATKAVIAETLVKLRNTVAAAVKRATDRTGNQYVVETGDVRTKSFDFLLVIAVTRTE